MKLWLPIAAIALLAAAYVYFYELSATEAQGSTSVGLANVVGLAAVIAGLVVAGVVLKRGSPPDRAPGGSASSLGG